MTLAAHNISLHLSGFDLLRNVSMQVQPGAVTAIVGPNGAGKSSLLRVLTGEMAPTAGEVIFNQRPLSDWPVQLKAQMLAVITSALAVEFSLYGKRSGGPGSHTPPDRHQSRCRDYCRRIKTGRCTISAKTFLYADVRGEKSSAYN